ncbi:MAG: GNAT family N-acetyltransferase [Gemmatimonadota bacterium]|nr:GNAT family N-acetyltransferase [Gemmatimonadota bacterium]
MALAEPSYLARVTTQPAPAIPAASKLAIRPVRTLAEYAACVALQDATWGAGFSERVPTAILKVAQRIGGVTAGAFAADGTLLGFVFGMTGVDNGRIVHWSDMLAVRTDARNLGIGQRLKAYQRDHCRRLGVEVIYWTYDPLVARNAYLNLGRLGARAVEYVCDMYGAETDSPLHRGIGSDRFVVAWEIARPSPTPGSDDIATLIPAAMEAPVVGTPESNDAPLARGVPLLRVEVPADIGAVQARSLDDAARWRASTRGAFTTALANGYAVAGFYRDAGGRCYYVLQC